MAGFLDKVKDGLSKGVATAGAHSKAVLEKTKINTVISNLEKERLQIEQMLGKEIYEMYNANGAIEANVNVVNLIAEIYKRTKSIEQQFEQLWRVDEELRMVTGGGGQGVPGGGPYCGACGCQNVPEALFCAGCGGKMDESQTSN